jgi:peptidoglycan/LPS O-acetylase OafA/YrhL
LTSRGHYAALDGLRGFAAIAVLLYHIGHWLNAPLLATNSGLAVDFFFCLSGFVLALAYDDRFRAGLSTSQFMISRLIRLMPLTILATIITATYVCFRSVAFKSPILPDELLAAVLLGLINVPYLTASHALGGSQVFPLNGPQYSLFLEIVVNLVWSMLRKFDQLWLSVAIFAVSFSLLPFIGLGGDEAATFWSGFPRVNASFFAGVAIYHFEQRTKALPALQNSGLWIVLIMGVWFFYPYPLPLKFELIWIALISPMIVYAGSKVRLSGKARSLALTGGALSYPIYVLHYPIFCWVNGGYQTAMNAPNLLFEGPLVLCCAVVGSYFALSLYDEPVRKWLARRAKPILQSEVGGRI